MPETPCQRQPAAHAVGDRVDVLHEGVWQPATVVAIHWWDDTKDREWPAYIVELADGRRAAKWQGWTRKG